MQETVGQLTEWLNQAAASGAFGVTVLAGAFLLGLLGAVVSLCCTLPMLGAIVGYSGSRRDVGVRAGLPAAISFMVGSIIAIVILGSVAGLASEVAQGMLGKYWKVFAGVVAIFFGLAAMNLLPFKMPTGGPKDSRAKPTTNLGAVVFGLATGGGVSVLSMCCNPGIFVVLGVVILQGYNLGAVGLLIAYAIGFSLPLAVIVLGVSLGKAAVKAKSVEAVVRIAAGVLLIAVGFYFLATL